MGDLTAKVGEDNNEHGCTTGILGLGLQNDNGKRLEEFCETNELCRGRMLLPFNNTDKMWRSPDGRNENQILDHLLVRRMWRMSPTDMRIKRVAEIFSNHHLLVAHR